MNRLFKELALPVAVMLTFIGALVLDLIRRSDLACGMGEDGAICAREWLSIAAPVVGILISAALIVRQIKAETNSFIPPAVDYIDQSNNFIGLANAKLKEIAGRLQYIETYGEYDGNDYYFEAFLREIELTTVGIDAVSIQSDVIRGHIDTNIIQDIGNIITKWGGIEYSILVCLQHGKIAEQINSSASSRKSARHIAEARIKEIYDGAVALIGEILPICAELDRMNQENSRRLADLNATIAGEIDFLRLHGVNPRATRR